MLRTDVLFNRNCYTDFTETLIRPLILKELLSMVMKIWIFIYLFIYKKQHGAVSNINTDFSVQFRSSRLLCICYVFFF